MYYGALKKLDIANGIGVRVSLFISGCQHHCKNCFNPETWNFSYGNPFTNDTLQELLHALEPEYINGLTLLGGEPLDPKNQADVAALLKKVKAQYPHKTIWCYTGYCLESDLLAENGCAHCPETHTLLSLLDVLVDGPYIESKRNLKLAFRGSENQRLIDIPHTLKKDVCVLWHA